MIENLQDNKLIIASQIFGGNYGSLDNWFKSFDFIEDFIKTNVSNWNSAPDTNALVQKFNLIIKDFNNIDFIFLLIHSGYIPENYEHDSSQETLYSKLVECVVCEWAKRIGFTDSFLQTQKSSKEDVTIKKGSKIIVSDAKSFRLGRSQAAPNVKDTIKKSDFQKWLESYSKEDRIGGLITFPSLHTWAKGTDVFLYTSDKETPILILYYEHLAFFLLKKELSSDNLIQLLNNYSEIHPDTTKSPKEYFERILPKLFGKNYTDWNSFLQISNEICKEKVRHTIRRIESSIKETEDIITLDVNKLDLVNLKQRLIKAEILNISGQLIKNLINIKKFRPH